MLPWIRTFTGRIRSFSCSNPEVETRLWKGMEEMYALYGVDCGKLNETDAGKSETADEKGEIGDVVS